MKKLLVLGLALLGILSASVAVMYFSKAAGSLPHFLPGFSQGSGHKHLKHGIAFAGLAVAFLLGAWMTSGPSTETAKPVKTRAGNPN